METSDRATNSAAKEMTDVVRKENENVQNFRNTQPPLMIARNVPFRPNPVIAISLESPKNNKEYYKLNQRGQSLTQVKKIHPTNKNVNLHTHQNTISNATMQNVQKSMTFSLGNQSLKTLQNIQPMPKNDNANRLPIININSSNVPPKSQLGWSTLQSSIKPLPQNPHKSATLNPPNVQKPNPTYIQNYQKPLSSQGINSQGVFQQKSSTFQLKSETVVQPSQNFQNNQNKQPMINRASAYTHNMSNMNKVSTIPRMGIKDTVFQDKNRPPNSRPPVPISTSNILPKQAHNKKRSYMRMEEKCDPSVAAFIELPNIPDVPPLRKLKTEEVALLEKLLQFKSYVYNEIIDNWKEDWAGNLQFLFKDIVTNHAQMFQKKESKPLTMTFINSIISEARSGDMRFNFYPIKLLFYYVHNLKDTPSSAKRILSYAINKPVETKQERSDLILNCVRRISYDPNVLKEDGWTILKSDKPIGASGGAYLIGRRIIWSRYEAIVIAFVRDEDIGDLWKAMWLEDLETFDLEADEMQDAIKKYEFKAARKKLKGSKSNLNRAPGIAANYSSAFSNNSKPSTSTRFSSTTNFSIEGIEHGIILASSYHEKARAGVLWPARVMHVSEFNDLGGSRLTSKRSSQKNNIQVVFLAPYWNGGLAKIKSAKLGDAQNVYESGPLFELDNIEVSSSTIQKYPHDEDSESLSIEQLRDSFKFLGLPKAAFHRYLDSHRIAQALKYYAKNHLEPPSNELNASAALTDTHTLSLKTAMFPKVILNLPYPYIISNLPKLNQQTISQKGNDDTEDECEPILQLVSIVKSMMPPFCWRKKMDSKMEVPNECNIATPVRSHQLTPVKSPEPRYSMSFACKEDEKDVHWTTSDFASGYLLNVIGHGNIKNAPHSFANSSILILGQQLRELVDRLCYEVSNVSRKRTNERKDTLNRLSKHILLVKGHGEDTFYSQTFSNELNIEHLVSEWRKACEKVYKCSCIKLSSDGIGNGVTIVITDSRCNQHLTASGSFERAVRIPAAIKGAKNVGAGKKKSIPLILKVNDVYMDTAEKNVIPRAHKPSYLKRMKAKITALPPDKKGLPLTDDSEGEGGEDTMGSRGSYVAAVTCVATALQAIDMVVRGECVNAFCATRPPGHHAGKELRPMNAVSNGFCLLNGAACAALYATMSQAEGGCGLKRVCVIDFDVHHGNGTQDILCSTYDPRFLYISIHAGGSHINGYESEGGDEHEFRLGSKQPKGIFPGRCGDSSPHAGVLNIPLGQKVTPHAVGNALVSKVSPAVRKFCPELIILSAGFDAHKNDPLGMGGLQAEDFGSVTEIACQMAGKCCSGRVVSILEGGYGVPCCRPPKDLFLPPPHPNFKVLDLGDSLPSTMDDDIDGNLVQALDKCHSEGFLECVQEHVGALSRCNVRKFSKSSN